MLIRRILHDHGHYDIQVVRPHRVRRNSIVKENELERTIEFIENGLDDRAALVLLLDADDDDWRELEPALRKRATKVSRNKFDVVFAEKEFECWLLGAKSSLRGCCGIKMTAEVPDNPESIRGAKARLTQNMAEGITYHEVKHQPAFAACFDLELCRKNCPSFDRFYNLVVTLSKQLKECSL